VTTSYTAPDDPTPAVRRAEAVLDTLLEHPIGTEPLRDALDAALDLAEIARNDRDHPAWTWGEHDHVICCTGCLQLLDVDPAAEHNDTLEPDNAMAIHRAAMLRVKMLGTAV
jgi:hypothetical protein